MWGLDFWSLPRRIQTCSLRRWSFLNMDSQPNSITITAYDAGGNPLAPPLTTTLPVAGQFRSM
jgi:hypothetical protein